jgi:hypothetical protein
MVPEMLFSAYFSGSVIDSPAAFRAAMWMIESTPFMAEANCSGNCVSPLMKGIPGNRFSCSPLLMLSKTTGNFPASRSALTTCEPMYPAPPTTKTVFFSESIPVNLFWIFDYFIEHSKRCILMRFGVNKKDGCAPGTGTWGIIYNSEILCFEKIKSSLSAFYPKTNMC